jgi:hypothetical protein
MSGTGALRQFVPEAARPSSRAAFGLPPLAASGALPASLPMRSVLWIGPQENFGGLKGYAGTWTEAPIGQSCGGV